MRTVVPEKILAIINDINEHGTATLTRLTVLKKWFQTPGRLPAFGLWIAQRAASRKGKTKGEAGRLLNEARVLLKTGVAKKDLFQRLERKPAQKLMERARDYQNEHKRHRWADVRLIRCWPLLLVEKGLALHINQGVQPAEGYRLAVLWAQHYDSRYGNTLNVPSRGKLDELVRFMFTIEALEVDVEIDG